MKEVCDICRGRRLITLPVIRPTAVATSEPEYLCAAARASSREYPCPECAQRVTEDRVAFVEAHSMIDDRIRDEGFTEYARDKLAHMLVAHLLRGDYIAFDQGRSDGMQRMMVATLGVVARSTVASMDERISQRQRHLASAVASEAISQINHWGSYFGRNIIEKTRAAEIIREAVAKVSKAWAESRAARSEEGAQ
jgi:hypothetical protein